MVSRLMRNFQEEFKTAKNELFQKKLNELFCRNNIAYITYLNLEKVFHDMFITEIIEDPVQAFLEDGVIYESLTSSSIYSVLLGVEIFEYENITMNEDVIYKKNYFKLINLIMEEVNKYIPDFEEKEELITKIEEGKLSVV